MHGRAWSITAMTILLCVSLGFTPALAEPQEGDVVATGQILAGAPLFDITSGVTGDLLIGQPVLVDGPHSFTFDATGLDGLWLWPQVHDPTGAGFVVGIHFLDAQGRFLEAECSGTPGSTGLATEPYGYLGATTQCMAPEGTATGWVYSWYGALLDVTVVVSSPPPPLPDGVVANGTVPVGAPYGDVAWWGMFGHTASSMFAVRANVTGLDGIRILTDVADAGGFGHDVRFTFRDANGGFLDADCTPMPGAVHPVETGGTDIRWSESCIVPTGAVVLDAALHYGALVHITLRTA